MKRVYVFSTCEIAEAFKMTAFHFGYEMDRIGSAVVAEEKEYQDVLDKTYAFPAAVVSVVENA